MLSPGDHRRSLQCGERTRTYLIHVPPGFDPAQPVPVVLVFHGGATNARTMARFCGLNETADRHGFLAVYPSGTGRNPNLLTWNAGNCCGDALRDNVDDVGFVAALLDDLAGLAESTPTAFLRPACRTGECSPIDWRWSSPNELRRLPRLPGRWEPTAADRRVRCRSCTFMARPTNSPPMRVVSAPKA